MVNAPATPPSEKLSTKALAAAGQFRAIALWLNEPLIPQGVFAQVQQDKRAGCIRITLEFEREPLQKPLIKYVCHLIWQLNSPLIEGIHLVARPIGQSKPLWEQRIRIMTPALKARLHREQGKASSAAYMPPQIAPKSPPAVHVGFNIQAIFTQQLKTLRAFMLTGSAVAAFAFGCMVEVVLSSRQEPSLPFDHQQSSRTEGRSLEAWNEAPTPAAEPRLPEFQKPPQTVLIDRKVVSPTRPQPEDEAVAEATTPAPEGTVSDRSHVVNAALEPVGVIQHERIKQPDDPTVTLVFGGDVNLDDLPYEDLKQDDQLLAGVPIYQEADLALVNLQDPLADAATSLGEELYNRKRPEAVNLLKAGGVDIVNLAGGQTLTVGEQGLNETLDNLDRNGIYRVGAGRTEREARRPEIVDVKGQRIAYLSYNLDPSQGAYDAVGGVNAAGMQEITQDIRAIRDEVDWLVVNYRWTGQPPAKPADSPTNLARLAIDQGADVVVGHHPTELQGAEIYKGRPIAYSLGDFIQGNAQENMTSAVLQVSLRGGQMKVDLIPVKVKAGQPQRVEEDEANHIFEQIQVASQEFESPMPPSIILDARSPLPTAAPPEADTDAFTEVDESPFTNSEPDESGLEETPAPPEEAPRFRLKKEDGDKPAKAVPETAPEGLEAPAPAEGTLFEVEMEPVPKDLLKDWGPKEGSGTIYEPESALPADMKGPDKPQKQTVDEPLKIEPAPQPEKQTDEPRSVAPESNETAPTETIAPYSEPLVGPLSEAAEMPSASEAELDEPTAAIATSPALPLGMPEAKVFPPLKKSLSSAQPAN